MARARWPEARALEGMKAKLPGEGRSSVPPVGVWQEVLASGYDTSAAVGAAIRGIPVGGLNRVANARQLRGAYLEVKNSPDGLDPEPLQLPRCVECPHCAWPVFVRQARVATTKTYERAGVTPDGEEYTPTTAPDEDDQEALEDLLRQENYRLEDDVKDLQKQREDLQQDISELSGRLDEAEHRLELEREKVEFLEEGETRWRDRCSRYKRLATEAERNLEFQGVRIGDLQSDMLRKLETIDALRDRFRAFKERRDAGLEATAAEFARAQFADELAVTFLSWRAVASLGQTQRKHEDVIRTSRAKLAQIPFLRAEAARLDGSLKAAGFRLLARGLCGNALPWAAAHALKAWAAAHQVFKAERATALTRRRLERATQQREEEAARADSLEEQLGEATASRDQAAALAAHVERSFQAVLQELSTLGSQVEASKARNNSEWDAITEAKIQRACVAACAEQEVRLRAEKDRAVRVLTEERNKLDRELASIAAEESKVLAVPPTEEDMRRVLPKGQGVLCCACARQLVHRGVDPLPPLATPQRARRRLEAEEKAFFARELQGMPDAEDPLHSSIFRARKDPYGVVRYASSRDAPADPQRILRVRSQGQLSPIRRGMKPGFR